MMSFALIMITLVLFLQLENHTDSLDPSGGNIAGNIQRAAALFILKTMEVHRTSQVLFKK